jgi:hypothetical protein
MASIPTGFLASCPLLLNYLDCYNHHCTLQFDRFRIYLFGTESKLLRFRHLIVNVVPLLLIFLTRNSTRSERCSGRLRGFNLDKMSVTCVSLSSWSTSYKYLMLIIPWNTGMSTKSGTSSSSRKCTKPIEPVGWVRIWYHGELGFSDNYHPFGQKA